MMEKLEDILKKITPLKPTWQGMAQMHLDTLTKPPGSLGRLESLASWVIQVTGKMPPPPSKMLLFTFAADHGVTAEGVSAYPKAVTAQMVLNFLEGGAAINVLARHAGAEVRVVDMGVDYDFSWHPKLIHRKIRRGTDNMAKGPAMSRASAIDAMMIGVALAREAAKEGASLLGTGEMGIGNTTASSAITAVMTGTPVAHVTGRGTGIGDEALALKQEVIRKAITLNDADSADPIGILAKVGGFEIGGIVGLILGAAAFRVPIIIDGFISTAAALIAVALKPALKSYLLAAHQSAEPGHQIALASLGLKPLLSFEMRLGEGTGAALAMSMVEAALRIFTEMATFEQAGVSQQDKTGKR